MSKTKWYHNAGDSWDNPMIKEFIPGEEPMDFAHGGFDSFEEAKADYVEYLNTDIQYRKDCKAALRKLKQK